MVISLMEYSSSVCLPHLRKDVDALERTQRRAARWTKTDYRHRSSITDMLNSLGLESLETRRHNSRLVPMYKILHGQMSITQEDLDLEIPDTRTRKNHAYKLKHPRCSTTEFRHSFAIRTVPEWNRLPASIAEGGSVQECKSQLAPRAV